MGVGRVGQGLVASRPVLLEKIVEIRTAVDVFHRFSSLIAGPAIAARRPQSPKRLHRSGLERLRRLHIFGFATTRVPLIIPVMNSLIPRLLVGALGHFLFFGQVAPAGSAELAPGGNSPAHLAAKQFLRGANLGNYLEAPPKANWGAKYTADDFVNIQGEGFDHVRVPIAWHHYAGPSPEFKLAAEIFAQADFLITNALNHGLNVILNIHHFDEFTSEPAAHTEKFYALWRQIAARYATSPPAVAFELLNEPKDKATTVLLNPIYAEAIRIIRETNPRRVIFVGPGKWNQVSELPNLHLPETDENLIVTVHCYDPFYFTHQSASWAGEDVKRLKGIQFPGPPGKPFVLDPALGLKASVTNWIQRYNTLPADQNPCSSRPFREKIKIAKQWSDEHQRPIHMGEFGCYVQADFSSRARFYKEFRVALEEVGMGWAVWDWKAGFRYWDDAKKQPAPGMREALFGAKAR